MTDRIRLSGLELMHLNNCATSTRMGMVDQGFPKQMRKLQSLKLVEQHENGFRTTTLGYQTLSQYATELKKL